MPELYQEGSHPPSSPQQLPFPEWEDWLTETHEIETVSSEEVSVEEQVTSSKKAHDVDTPKQLPLPGEFRELMGDD
jgi:hypothetical protein